MRSLAQALLAVLCLVFAPQNENGAWAQEESAIIAPARFARLSINALLATDPESRRGARAMLAEQLAQLPDDMQMKLTGALFKAMMSSTEQQETIEIAAVLGGSRVPWATPNPSADHSALYDRYVQSENENVKPMLDLALQNAKGLYRDGIHNYNTKVLERVHRAIPKLKTMAENYPKSRYAENAAFYVGQAWVKTYFLGDTKDLQSIREADKAFESYIARAESKEFPKDDYLAAGYFFRALDGIIKDDVTDAESWLKRGKGRFSNDDRIYVYQLFPSPRRIFVIDKFLPAQKVFSAMLGFLSKHPNTTERDHAALLDVILDID